MNAPIKNIRVYQNNDLCVGKTIAPSTRNRQYLLKVLRLKENSQLTLFNGDGYNYQTQLVKNSANYQLKITSKQKNTRELTTKITLAQALTKSDKMDWLVQKSVELGVHQIIPLISQRVVVKLNQEKQQKRQAHWQAIVISACEQCGRSVVPIVKPVITLADFLMENSQSGFVLNHLAKQTLSTQNQTKQTQLLVGPEGGFTENELALAEKHQQTSLKLTNTVLRSETAGLVALAQFALLWQ